MKIGNHRKSLNYPNKLIYIPNHLLHYNVASNREWKGFGKRKPT